MKKTLFTEEQRGALREMSAKIRLSKTERKILKALTVGKWFVIRDVVKATKLSLAEVKKALFDLADENLIQTKRFRESRIVHFRRLV